MIGGWRKNETIRQSLRFLGVTFLAALCVLPVAYAQIETVIVTRTAIEIAVLRELSLAHSWPCALTKVWTPTEGTTESTLASWTSMCAGKMVDWRSAEVRPWS